MNRPRSPRNHRSSRFGTQTLGALFALSAFAATPNLEPPPWTLSSEARTKVGYDSNLFERANGEGDGFFELTPLFRLTRRPAISALSLEAYVRAVAFTEWSNENFVDESIKARYRYPAEEEVLISTDVNVLAARSHVANYDIGRRVRETDLSLSVESTFAATGKTVLRGRLTARRLDYAADDLNTNATGGIGLAWVLTPNEKLQFEAGGDLFRRQSTPHRDGAPTIRQTEPALTFRARGNFSPRTSGQIYVGLTDSHYSGIRRERKLDVIGGANVAWAMSPRRTLRIRADRRVYFSAEGDQALDTRVGADFEQKLSTGLIFSVGAETARTNYRREYTYRHDRSYPFRASVAVPLRQRLSANFEASWSRQTSDQEFRNFHRTMANADVRYRF